MRICFNSIWVLGVAMAVQAGTVPEPTRRVTSVVHADPHSGRLVRSVVVTARPVTPKVIAPQPVAEKTTTPAAKEPPPLPLELGVPRIVDELSRLYQVDPLLVHSVIKVESNYNPFAVSPKGAQGLMQLIPSTARRFGVSNTFDIKENIRGGVRYLKYLQGLFPDARHVLAAYNAGEEAVIKYRGIPPYPETRNYVYQVGKRLGELKAVERARSNAQSQDAPAKEANPRIEQFTDEKGAVHYVTR
jgi:hypothetical protein